MQLILASNSPRRRKILTEYGYDFIVCVSDFCEAKNEKNPYDLAVKNALGKAHDVYNKVANTNPFPVVLGADTVVCFENKILGKPKTKSEAETMLKSYSGKSQLVITGYAIISPKGEFSGYAKTEVEFNTLSDGLIKEYVETMLPLDKAGGYGIQDGFPLVKSIKGSLNNVIGLPIEDINEKLKIIGF